MNSTSFCSSVALVASFTDSLRALLFLLVIVGFILLSSSSLCSAHKNNVNVASIK